MSKRSAVRCLSTCATVALLVASGQCRQKTAQEAQDLSPLRQPAVAGSFYPQDPQLLIQQVDHFLADVPSQTLPGRLIGLVAPHAGYVFSGGVAAYSYRTLVGQEYDTVILVGCSHHARYSGASVYPRGAYQTPLGLVPIDEEMVAQLTSQAQGLRYVPEADQAEHSLEVQLPFLQKVLKEFRLVPVLLGPDCSYPMLESLAHAIARACAERQRVLLVASTDMSHYPEYDQACRVDRETLKAIEAFDPRALAEHQARWMKKGIDQLHCTLCSTEAVMVVMMAARELGADKVRVLKYANSGDVPAGDRQKVVGYCAVAFCQEDGRPAEEKVGMGDELNRPEQEELLRIARESIAARLRNRSYSPPESCSTRLLDRRGAFVTLHKQGGLRGCIGRFQPDVSLAETVVQMAQAAAFEDGRFPPLSAQELDQVEIEISVLSPLRKVASIDEIEMGRHGIWITRGGRSGCFLPQVATETGWSKQEFLEHCCRDKAFLPKDAYLEPGTDIYIFTAQVFHEE